MGKPTLFMPQAWEDYLYWQMQDKKTLRRINQLLQDVQRDGFAGVGKPEPLRGGLSGYWSRRIDDANRLVYKITADAVIVVSCRSHYED
jgi:toxin YoeB